MEINHEDKNLGEPLDINQAVNDLIDKTVTIIESSPEEASTKQIRDVKNALENLKGVDKTLNYELFPETKEKLEKLKNEAPELEYRHDPSVQRPSKNENDFEEPDPESSKESNELEEPTEADRKKYNEVIDEKLDKTIKTLEEIEEATNVEGKNEQEIEATKVLSGKIAKKVVLEFLGNSVKKLARVEVPDKKEEKMSNEMDLNPDGENKNSEPIESNISKQEKVTSSVEHNNLSESSKVTQDVDAYSTEQSSKTVNNIEEDLTEYEKRTNNVNGLVDLINSEVNSTLRANNTEIDNANGEEDKTSRETPTTEITTNKNDNPVEDDTIETGKVNIDFNRIYPDVADISKESREIEPANEGDEKVANEFTSVKGEGKIANEIEEADEGEDKNQNDVTTALEDGKTRTDLDIETSQTSKNTEEIDSTPNKPNKIANNLSDDDANPEIDDETKRKRSLIYQPDQEIDIENSVFRGDNSGATVQGYDRKKGGLTDTDESGTQLYGQYDRVNDQGLTETVVYDATVSGAEDNRTYKTTTDEDIETEDLDLNSKGEGPSLDRAEQGESKPGGPSETGTALGNADPRNVARLGKGDIIGSLLNMYFLLNLVEVRRESLKYTRQINTDQAAREISNELGRLSEHTANGIRKYKSLSDEEDKPYVAGAIKIDSDKVKKNRYSLVDSNDPEGKRSFNKSPHPNSTGYLRIYTKRAVDMKGTLAKQEGDQAKILPFQFEPGYSGDSKKAEYSSIGTLGRSGSAKVYTKSQERSIQLTLDYVVTGPRIGEEPNEEDLGHSISSQSMTGWSEDYIYNYIVPNFRNLVKPNVGQSTSRKFRLGPPIIQVWYGGLGYMSGSSTGIGQHEHPKENTTSREEFKNIPPAFLTSWMIDGRTMMTYRSLWLPQSVDVEYSGGIVNYESRNKVRVTIEVSLVEIGPSVTANEILNWWNVT